MLSYMLTYCTIRTFDRPLVRLLDLVDALDAAQVSLAIRSNQPISDLLLWDHTKLVGCKCSKGASNDANYSRQLLKAIGRVEGIVTSDKEVHKLINVG
jgi:hypothetical protein